MEKRTFIILPLLLFLCGCIAIPGEVTQKVQRDGTSKIIMEVNTTTSYELYVQQVRTFVTYSLGTMMGEGGISMSEWSYFTSVLESQYGFNSSDPVLSYPGQFLPTGTRDAIFELISNASHDQYLSVVVEPQCDTLKLFIAAVNATCESEGERLLLKGDYVPKRKGFFSVNTTDPAYITYRYNPAGSLEMFVVSVPGEEVISPFGSLSDHLEPVLDMLSDENLNESQLAEIEQMLAEVNSLMGGSLEEGTTLIIEMPGEITSTTIGTITNNTVKLSMNVVELSTTRHYIESREPKPPQELDPLVYYAGAGAVGALAVGAYAVGRKKPKRSRAKSKKRKRG